MSWDVILMQVPESVKSIKDITDDVHFELGPRKNVVGLLKKTAPEISIPSEDFGWVDGEDFSIEVYIGNNETVDTIMLAVRGSDNAIRVIEKVCKGTGWRAYDTTTDRFIDFKENPSEGFKQWKAYRDAIANHLKSSGETVTVDPKIHVIKKPKHWWEFWK